MAGIQDPLTDLPPPSRLDFEELSNFSFDASSAPSLPPAFISWAGDGDLRIPLRPRLLLIASSPSGLHLLQHLTGKQLLCSVILPADNHSDEGNPFSNDSSNPDSFSDDGNLKGQSIYDGRNPKRQSAHTCDVYALDGEQASVVMVAVQSPVAEERANSWARVVLEALVPERVLMVAMVQREHFRGKLSADDEVVFRLETDALRTEGSERAQGELSLKDSVREQGIVPYFPSGSLISGLPAAVLTRCQLLGLKARLLLSWPEAGSSATSFLASVLHCFPDTTSLDFSCSLQVPFKGKSVADLDIYF
eukprot:c6792_g1_i1 orf=448-1365(-)